MRELSDSIERSVENIDNGVIITMTSDDADAVEMLQSREAKGPQNDDVTRTQENIDNGVRITITSDDEDTVAKIQEHAAEGKGPEFGEHRGGGYGEVHGHRRSEEEENEEKSNIGNTKIMGNGEIPADAGIFYGETSISHILFF